jgi:L-threonylcarbamoyladenylate synthase
MSGPRRVTARQLREVTDALGAGCVIAVPGDGGYQLAVLHTHRDAVARLFEHTPAVHVEFVVGRRAQAAELTPQWSKQMAHLTDRMWPGPLAVIVPARLDEYVTSQQGEPVVVSMPAWRPLRTLCRQSGPLAVVALRRADGGPLVTAEEVYTHLAEEDIAFVVDGGWRGGPRSTVVDCTLSPPQVRSVGALPESYVEAALLLGARTRRWFTRRSNSGPQ